MLEFIKSVCATVGSWIGLSPLYAGIVLLAVAVILVVALIALIVALSKKNKANKTVVVDSNTEEKQEPERDSVEPAIAQEENQTVTEDKEDITNAIVKEEDDMKKDTKETKATNTKETKTPAKKQVSAKSAPAKKSVSKPASPVAKAPAKKLNGKWIVEHKSDTEYISKLLASNGEVMLSSEIYSTEEGAVAGISTIIKGVDTGNFVIYQDKNKNYYYKLKTAGNRFLCAGEIYKSEDQCNKAVETVKRIAKDSAIADDVVKGSEYIKYKPAKLNIDAVKKSVKGKWKVETTPSGKFSAKLYANNGQLMLATEEVAQKKTAVNAIESVTKNAELGNFIIDRDKFGRYYYKLRNAQKSVICIGEAYDSLDSCTSALESVRRFAINSTVVKD